MTHLVLVRHGEAAAGWGDDHDPGLSDTGRVQAAAVADLLAGEQPRPILTSPLRRCRETAAALAGRWQLEPVVDPAVGEVESPDPDLGARRAWLDVFLHERWANLDDRLRAWRQQVVDHLVAIERDTVVFTHFVAINVAIGAATGDDRVLCRHVDNCSTTVLVSDGSSLSLSEAPTERETRVL